MIGNNMFAYCNNNPIVYSDPYGQALRPNIRIINDGAGSSRKETSNDSALKKILDAMTDKRKEGNTFSAGLSYGYTSGGTTFGKSAVLSVDTSHNYAFQESTSVGAATGAGESLGLVMTYTNATDVQDLRGASTSYGVTLVSLAGISVDYITFVPDSNPNTTCWGISVVISLGGEIEAHSSQNYTTSSDSWNPLIALRDFLYGG